MKSYQYKKERIKVMQFTPSLREKTWKVYSMVSIPLLIEYLPSLKIAEPGGSGLTRDIGPGCKSPKHKPNANIYGKLTRNYQPAWKYVIAAKGQPKGGIGGTALYVKLLHAECAASIISTKEPQ